MFIGHFALGFGAKRLVPKASLGTLFLACHLFGPPPPNVEAVAWSAQAIGLLVLWAYWVDRHREARAAGAAG